MSRYSKGTAIAREQGQLSTFSPPWQKPIRALSADDLFFRSQAVGLVGEAGQLDVNLLASDYSELDAMIGRTEAKMISDCLFRGRSSPETATPTRSSRRSIMAHPRRLRPPSCGGPDIGPSH